MNIAIIGAGNVGGALGRGWAKAGHRVIYGVRDQHAEKTKALLAATAGDAVAASPAEAVQAAEWVARATPWNATESAVRAVGAVAWRGKAVVVMDAVSSELG